MTRLSTYVGISGLFVSIFAPPLAAQGSGQPTPHRHVARRALAPRKVTSAAAGTAASTGAAAPAPAPAPDSLQYDAGSNTVTFQLVAGGAGAKSPFNFNGYVGGEATLVVPPKSKIVMRFVNADGTPHSAEVIADKDPMPNMGAPEDAALPQAYTTKVTEGLPQGGKDTMRFTAPDQGSFRVFCGVPGHGLSGMWIRLTVDPAAKAPSFSASK